MLKVSNLSKNFGDFKAVCDVSFELERGNVLIIAGHSGSGKSTLLRLLNGLETPDSGEISGGTFGLVFQEFNLFPQYTVWENVTLAPKLLGKDTEKVPETLKRLGIWDKKDSYPSQLSGGQKQRTAIARALVLRPDVLCFDEPTSALDPELTGEVINLINSLKGSQTMIIVTHDMAVCKEVEGIVAKMQDGKLFLDKHNTVV